MSNNARMYVRRLVIRAMDALDNGNHENAHAIHDAFVRGSMCGGASARGAVWDEQWCAEMRARSVEE